MVLVLLASKLIFTLLLDVLTATKLSHGHRAFSPANVFTEANEQSV